jgi:hypothetical protein
VLRPCSRLPANDDDADAVLLRRTRTPLGIDRGSHVVLRAPSWPTCAPCDADDPCELPLRGRPSCPSTRVPDADGACGEPPRERADDDAESASLPPSHAVDDADERPWPPSSDDDDAVLQLLHEPCVDDGAWGLRTSCVACVG